MKNQKGITLIALVITIIVMLILVTVTIRVATDGNLFTHAANAVKGTKTAIEGENAILNDELDSSIEDIVAEQTGATTGTTIHFTINGVGYDVPAGTTWADFVEEHSDSYHITADNRVNQGDAKGDFVKLNGNYVEPESAIQNEDYTIAG